MSNSSPVLYAALGLDAIGCLAWDAARRIDMAAVEAEMRRGRQITSLADVVHEMVTRRTNAKRAEVLDALILEFRMIISERDYELATPGAFEEISFVLRKALVPDVVPACCIERVCVSDTHCPSETMMC